MATLFLILLCQIATVCSLSSPVFTSSPQPPPLPSPSPPQSPPAFITNDVLTGCNCAYAATNTYQVCFTAGDDTSGTVYQYTNGNFASGNGACVPNRPPTASAGMRTRAAR